MDRRRTDTGYLAMLSCILAPPPEICRRFDGDANNPRSPSKTAYITPGKWEAKRPFILLSGVSGTPASNDRKRSRLVYTCIIIYKQQDNENKKNKT